MSDLTVGLMGASYVAASRMVPAFQATGMATRALFDPEERRLERWRDQDFDLLTSNLEEFLASGIDAVYISSRNDQHAGHAIAAAGAGMHVLLDKPMALTLADARAIIAAADQAGVQLAVNHHLPGSPLHAAARRLVAEGRIGSLYSARINHAVLLPEHLRGWRLADVPGGGVVYDITVHDASVLNPLFGAAPKRVTALGVSQAAWNQAGTRDSVMTVLEYPAGDNGVPGLAQTHDAFTIAHPGTSMEIHGERGAVVIGDAMTQDTPGTVELHTADGIEQIDVDCSQDLYQIIVRAFAAAISGEGRATATGMDGLRALQVAIAVEESLRTGQVVNVDDLG
jgi:1,5-anhydro-D-fructose reductase (1,5-anhydro-D-mannitol-forming)